MFVKMNQDSEFIIQYLTNSLGMWLALKEVRQWAAIPEATQWKEKRMKLKPWIILFFFSSALFITLAIFVGAEPVTEWDSAIEQLVRSIHSQLNTILCKALSILGKWYGYAAVSCLLFLLPKTRFSVGFPVGCTLGMAIVMNKILKTLLAIERPADFRLTQVHGYSFPSGHAMYGMAFVGMLVYILIIKMKFNWSKLAAFSFAVLFLLAVGFSRVYLGAHHPSDVIGGYLAGTIILTITIPLYKRLNGH